nr:hypothetical protein [Tanacetum cinerariifolium]
MEVHVPHEIISNHILPRIPAKSVCRFKCVSKEWHSFLTSDTFKNKHNDHNIDDHENNLKLLVLYKTKALFEFTTIDCEAAPSDKGLTPTCLPLPQFGGTTPHDIHILTSFHGLVCLGIIKENGDIGYSDLILWNPLTNEYKSCCEDDYKLLFVDLFDNNVYIYALRLDSWKKIDIKLCKLDEYGNMKEVLTYELRPNVYDHTISSLIPFHLMKNGNWLMLKNCWHSNNDRIYKVDLKKKRHITNKGKEKEKGNIHVDFEYANVRMDDNTNISNLVHEEVRYIETFVSPNR